MLDTIHYSTHLLVMRHGQAQLYAHSDHQRALSDDGKIEVLKSAKFIAEFLSTQVITHIDILVSDAARTLSTWSVIKDYLNAENISLGQSYSVSERADLYLASTTKLQSLITDTQVRFHEHILSEATLNEADSQCSHLILMIAHNPGSSDLIYDLVGKTAQLKTSQIAQLYQDTPFDLWALQALVS